MLFRSPSLKRMRELGVGTGDAPEPNRIDVATRVPRTIEPDNAPTDRIV